MERHWKWVERILWIMTIISLVTSFTKGWTIKMSIEQVWNNLTPWQWIFFLSVVIFLCLFLNWFIRFLIDIYKVRKTYHTLINWVDELEKKLNQNIEPRINELEKPAQLEVLRKAILKEK